jgi:hypothetical protein
MPMSFVPQMLTAEGSLSGTFQISGLNPSHDGFVCWAILVDTSFGAPTFGSMTIRDGTTVLAEMSLLAESEITDGFKLYVIGGPRPLGATTIRCVASPLSGPFAYVVATNLPGSDYEVLVNEAAGSVDHYDLVVPTRSMLFGFSWALGNGAFDLTPPDPDLIEERTNVIQNSAGTVDNGRVIGWAYEPASPNPSFSLDHDSNMIKWVFALGSPEVGIPKLRQRQRDDQRVAFTRAKNGPTSVQKSIRQGWGRWNNYF